MAETEDVVKLVDGAYKNILERFNPSARQLVTAGKAYLKALHGALSASKTYIEALSKLARHAHQGTWGGCADIGTALMQLVDVQKEIESQQLNILKAFYVDLLVPLESNIDKDTKIVACEQKRFLQQHKCLQESYLKAAATVRKQKKKGKSSRGPNVEKEIKNMQALEEEKMKLDCFCERSLKQAIIQERRRFGFVLERQCSLTKHNLVYYSQGQNLLEHRLEEWEEVAKGREALPEPIDKLFPPNNDFKACGEYATANLLVDSNLCLSGGGTLRKTRSIDTSCMDLREAPSDLPCGRGLTRAKSDFNLASSSVSLTSDDYGDPRANSHKGSFRPKSLVPSGRNDPLSRKVRAMYSYLSSGEHQMSFHEGDIIVLVGSRNKGWQYGENQRNHRCGWFPIAYTESISSMLNDLNEDDISYESDPYSRTDYPQLKNTVTRSKTAPSIRTHESGNGGWLDSYSVSYSSSAASSPLSSDGGGPIMHLPPAPQHRPFSTFVESAGAFDGYQQYRRGSKFGGAPPSNLPGCCAAPATPAPGAPMTSSDEGGFPRRTQPPSSLHGSNDSGFCNDGNHCGGNSASSTIAATCKQTTSYTHHHCPGEIYDEDEDNDLKPKGNIFASVKLRKVVTNDRSAPMIS